MNSSLPDNAVSDSHGTIDCGTSQPLIAGEISPSAANSAISHAASAAPVWGVLSGGVIRAFTFLASFRSYRLGKDKQADIRVTSPARFKGPTAGCSVQITWNGHGHYGFGLETGDDSEGSMDNASFTVRNLGKYPIEVRGLQRYILAKNESCPLSNGFYIQLVPAEPYCPPEASSIRMSSSLK